MSGVRKKDQTEHRFTTLDIVLDMYDHTTTVTANPKFDKCPKIRDRIDDEAALIYHFNLQAKPMVRKPVGRS